MWPTLATRAPVFTLASLVLLLLLSADATTTQGDSHTSATHDASRPASNTLTAEPTCESRTVNYITHTLPQQCLTSSPSPPVPNSVSVSVTVTVTPTAATATSVEFTPEASTAGSTAAQEELDADGNDLSTGAFMSFEEWKAMMLAKSPDVLEPKQRKPKDGRGDAYTGEGFDSLGDEGEISLDFEAYSDKISEITSSTKPSEREKERADQVEKVTHGDEGLTHYRSKDAGKTCKERFSYSSFDGGATVLKASPAAKNPTAILVENKDSYMLLECGMENKFFIVELSDVILVDTVVLANFEFFSSMVRHFRVSISDRYPVKLEKWKELGNFEARNSRDIQAFLVENPQDWARYLRVEILSHYGNEYYCPVSLLRVHGMRMLDSWKLADAADLDSEEESSKAMSELIEETIEVVEEPPEETAVAEPIQVENKTVMVVEQRVCMPYWDKSYFQRAFAPQMTCAASVTAHPTSQSHEEEEREAAPTRSQPAGTAEQTSAVTANSSSAEITTAQTTEPSSEVSNDRPSASSEKQASSTTHTTDVAPTSMPSAEPSAANISTSTSSTASSQVSVETSTGQSGPRNRTTAPTSIRPPSSRSSVKATPSSPTTPRNKTSTTTSSGAATPTVQDSFFKALTKRLQTLESNTTLSMQYIESQSKFLQEALARLEKRQVAKVDRFLDTLNKTVLGELREARTQYDQIWQSTVIALETQREQSQREIVALSSRLGMLADEVVFQKRMAILQSVLLLGCLVLVIFSRGGLAGASVESYYPNQFIGSSSRLASPIYPSTPKVPHHKNSLNNAGHLTAVEPHSTNGSPVSNGSLRNSAQPGMRFEDSRSRSPSQSPEIQRRPNSRGTGFHSSQRPVSPNRAFTDPQCMEYFQPATPASVDIGYDSEPALTPNGDYFSAAGSVNGEHGTPAGGGSSSYPDLLARQSERQLTPTSEVDIAEYGTRSGRPMIPHAGPAQKPLPTLPEDPD